MCSHANMAALNGAMGEHQPSNISEKVSEKSNESSVIPSSDLECLQPGFNPKNLQTILKESILLGTGGVAILLQMAHPGVAQGVDEFSNFAYRPSDRR